MLDPDHVGTQVQSFVGTPVSQLAWNEKQQGRGKSLCAGVRGPGRGPHTKERVSL